MESNELHKIKKVLEKNDYLLKIVLKDDGCEVQFPHNQYTSRHKKPLVNTYNVIDKGKNKHLIIKKSSRRAQTKDILCPSYATKINIFVDILAYCIKIDYNINLMCCYDQNNKPITNEELFTAVIPPIKCKEKEAKLYELFLNYTQENGNEDIEKLAKKYKLMDGYKSMLDILEQGE